MAIQFKYTDPNTGAECPKAHMILDDPIIRGDVEHVTVRGRVYASKEDYDAGKQPITTLEREYESTEYLELRAATMPVCEGWILEENHPDGKPVPDSMLTILPSAPVSVAD